MKARSILLAYAMFIAGFAYAAPTLTFHFEAIVDQVDDFNNVLGGQVQIGNVIEGSYTFDATKPNEHFPDFGRYFYDNYPGEFEWISQIGALTWTAIEEDLVNFSSEIGIRNNQPDIAPRDSYHVFTREMDGIGKCEYGSMSMWIELITFNNLDTFASVDLPLTPPDLSRFESTNSIRIDNTGCYSETGDYFIRGHLTSLRKETITVSIDIKPGSDPNSINLCSNGAVPVAILGSDTLDVSSVNTDTLRFAEAAVKVVGKKDTHTLCSYEDINGDFIDDLICHYVTTDIAGIDGESTTTTVNGELLDGTPIQGTDGVNIVKDTCG